MISLYKEGNTHIVRGVTCELTRFKPVDVEVALSKGYVLCPNDLYKTIDSVDTNHSGKLSNKEIREAAKKAGIESYSKARIANLKKELGL